MGTFDRRPMQEESAPRLIFTALPYEDEEWRFSKPRFAITPHDPHLKDARYLRGAQLLYNLHARHPAM